MILQPYFGLNPRITMLNTVYNSLVLKAQFL